MGRFIVANQAVVVMGAMLQALLGGKDRRPSSGRVAERLLVPLAHLVLLGMRNRAERGRR